MDDAKDGECLADLIALHELGHAAPGDGGDGVPEHPEDVGQVEHPDLGHAGREELANDVANHGQDDDGGVAPLQISTHYRHQGNLEYYQNYFHCFYEIFHKNITLHKLGQGNS